MQVSKIRLLRIHSNGEWHNWRRTIMTTEGFFKEPVGVRALAGKESLASDNGIGDGDSLASSAMMLSQLTWDGIKEKVFGCPTSAVYDGAMKEVIARFYEQSKIKIVSDELTKHNCEIKSDDQAVDLANRVLEKLGDPFTHVLKKSEVDEMTRAIRGDTSLKGIGIVVGPDKAGDKSAVRPKAQMVFPGTPADRAGVRNGDLILSVDGKDTKGLTMEEVTRLIKGEKGTEVTLRVDRQGKMLDLKPVRDVVNIPAAIERRVGDVLYVRLFDFVNDKTDQGLRGALMENSDAKGLILDLRGNGGGRVDEMIEVLGIVMRQGKIVDSVETEKTLLGGARQSNYSHVLYEDSSVVRREGIPVARMSRTRNWLGERPLVLLVDEYSASASELMAGALKDNQAAVIVGEKTFGKGIGQSMIPSANGTMVLVTDTKYKSPNGTWAGDGNLQKNGITPHFDVPLGDFYVPLTDEDTQFTKAMEVIRAKIDKKG